MLNSLGQTLPTKAWWCFTWTQPRPEPSRNTCKADEQGEEQDCRVGGSQCSWQQLRPCGEQGRDGSSQTVGATQPRQPLRWLQRKLASNWYGADPSCERDFCADTLQNLSLKMCSFAPGQGWCWEKTRMRIPTTFLSFGKNTGQGSLGLKGVCYSEPPHHQDNPKIPEGFCYVTGSRELEISLLLWPELAALLNHTRVSGDSFRKLLTSFWALLPAALSEISLCQIHLVMPGNTAFCSKHTNYTATSVSASHQTTIKTVSFCDKTSPQQNHSHMSLITQPWTQCCS